MTVEDYKYFMNKILHIVKAGKGDYKHDILNTMLAVINGLQSSLRRGGMEEDDYELNESATATQFEDRFENLLTGWSLTMSIEMRNDNVTFGGTNCD